MARTTRESASPISGIFLFTGIILLVVGFFAAAYYASMPILIGTVAVAIAFIIASAILSRIGKQAARHESMPPRRSPAGPARATGSREKAGRPPPPAREDSDSRLPPP